MVYRRVVQDIVPEVADESWFFDTELLVRAERRGYRIRDLAVEWREDDDSRVKLIRTAWDDLKGIARLRLEFWRKALLPDRNRATPVPKHPDPVKLTPP